MNHIKAARGRKAIGVSPVEFRVRLTPELMGVLDLYSEQTGLSRSALIREAVAQWAHRLGALPTADVPLTNYTNTKENS